MDRIRPPTSGLPVKKHWSTNGDCTWMYIPYELVHARFFSTDGGIIIVLYSITSESEKTKSHFINHASFVQLRWKPPICWDTELEFHLGDFTRSLPCTYHKILVDGQGSKEWSWTLKWLWKPSQPRGGGTSHQWYPIPPNPQPKTFSDR